MTMTMLARATFGVAVAMPLAIAGCTQPSSEPASTTPSQAPSSPAPSPSATPSVDPAVIEAESLVLEAYRGYWAAKVTSFSDPSQPQDPSLAVYAIDTALTDAQATLFQLQQDGIRLVGEPVLEPAVTEISLDPDGIATITDCVDSSNWTPVLAAWPQATRSRTGQSRRSQASLTDPRSTSGVTS